jgi:hypothetical protein
MTQYRIVKWDGRYRIQYRWLFFWLWITTIADCPAEYDLEEAKEQIKQWQEWEKENGKVVK